jgi:hypothetical protein
MGKMEKWEKWKNGKNGKNCIKIEHFFIQYK